MNYVVPNFGMDHEIAYSLANTAAAETSLNNVWNVEHV
jgi:hypothetical protein